jgi:hydrogenase maturation protease
MITTRVLVFGIGNPGRRDDGLGPALADALARTELGPKSVTSEFRYQLNVEDALTMKDFDIVVFADAAKSGRTPVTLMKIEPAATIAFSTHALDPASVLALCAELYGRAPDGYALAIRGEEFDIGEGLSPRAERNLVSALGTLASFFRGIA